MKLAMSTLELIKRMEELVCSQQCPRSITCLPILQNLNNENKRKQMEKKKPKKCATLDYNLHFGSPNHELSFNYFLV